MKQLSSMNPTAWMLSLSVLCLGACDDSALLDVDNASAASRVALTPACAYVDSGVPVLTSLPVLAPKTLNIWPPNHKFHSFGVADCVTVTSACDPGLTAEFIWASSDEPVDDRGDGHHAPDILFDGCDQVQLRSERQGPKDGRVYKLGVRVIDGAGNASETSCSVVVDHDQRGVLGSDSGESYRVLPTALTTGLACDGRPELPPLAPTPVPPAPVGF